MPRPVYETAENLKSEKDIALFLKEKHKLNCFKMPISYRIDWAVLSFSGKLRGFMELKVRSVAKKRYPTLMLSLGKCITGCNLAQSTGTAFWVAVKWTDCFGVYRVVQPFEDVGVGGRTDRGDSADVEPVVYFPVDSFTETIFESDHI